MFVKALPIIDLKTIASHAKNLNDCWTSMASANDYTMDHDGQDDSLTVPKDHDGWELNEYSRIH